MEVGICSECFARPLGMKIEIGPTSEIRIITRSRGIWKSVICSSKAKKMA